MRQLTPWHGGGVHILTLTERLDTQPELTVEAERLFDGTDIYHGGFAIDISEHKILNVRRLDRVADSQSSSKMPKIQLQDATLLPGLIDAHVHLSGRRSHMMDDRITNHIVTRALRAADDAGKLLQAGYTTVRDVGSVIALSLRDSIHDQTLLGPRIIAAGPIISQTGGHADHHYLPLAEAQQAEGCILADGIDECRKAVRQAVRMGADVIKICTTGGVGSAGDHPSDSHFTVKEVAAMVDEAHRLRRPVAAHAQGTDGILTALHGGVDTIEHATYLTDECAAIAKDQGTWLVPTVALRRAFIQSLDSGVAMPPWRVVKQREAIQDIQIGFEAAVKWGLNIACGSDFTGIPNREHGRNAQEPIEMVALGYSPIQALRAATSRASQMLRIDHEVGALIPGMIADVIAVRGNPTEDIKALEAVQLVIARGRIVPMLQKGAE